MKITMDSWHAILEMDINKIKWDICKYIFLNFYVFFIAILFMYTYVYHLLALKGMSMKGKWVYLCGWNWNFIWLQAATWVLRIKFRSFGRVACTLGNWVHPPPQTRSLNNFINLKLIKYGITNINQQV